MAHDDVGLPVADQPGDLLPVFERWDQFPVVDVEDLVLDPEDLGALRHFRFPPLRQRAAGLFEVADIAVGHRHELHLVAGRRPHGRHPARLELRIVGMRAEGDDAQRSLGGSLGGLGGGVRGQDGDDEQDSRRSIVTLVSLKTVIVCLPSA
jgi:hypothetical protein